MRYLKIILFNLFLLFILLLIVEIALWQYYPNYQYYYRSHPGQADLKEVLAKTDTSWLQAHKTLGWVCQQKSSLDFPSPPVANIHYNINAEGFRNAFDFTDTLPEDKKRVLLMGDSFMFGVYLPEEQTITASLQAAKGDTHVFYNMAVPAWGLDQMYLAYLEYVDLIQPDQVIFAFVDDDLMRSLEILFYGCGLKPCLKQVDDQLVPKQEDPHWWEYICWNNQIGNRFLLTHYQQEAADLGQFMLGEIIRREQAAGRKPAFLRIPALVDLEAQEARTVFSMKAFMKGQEVNYLELYDSLSRLSPATYRSYYIPDDGHPTAAGANLLATYLLEWL